MEANLVMENAALREALVAMLDWALGDLDDAVALDRAVGLARQALGQGE